MTDPYLDLVTAAGLDPDADHDDLVVELRDMRARLDAAEGELARIDRRLALDLPGRTRSEGDRVAEIDRRLYAADEEIAVLRARLRPYPDQKRTPGWATK